MGISKVTSTFLRYALEKEYVLFISHNVDTSQLKQLQYSVRVYGYIITPYGYMALLTILLFLKDDFNLLMMQLRIP